MIQSKSDYLFYVEQDRIANQIPRERFFDILFRFIAPNYTYKFLKTLRKVEYLKNTKGPKSIAFIYYKYKFRRLSLKLGFTIPENVFGPGLSIPHYGTIVVNGSSRIGAYCRLHAGVNIGASAGKKAAPCIGNNVYIGPGAIYLGI